MSKKYISFSNSIFSTSVNFNLSHHCMVLQPHCTHSFVFINMKIAPLKSEQPLIIIDFVVINELLTYSHCLMFLSKSIEFNNESMLKVQEKLQLLRGLALLVTGPPKTNSTTSKNQPTFHNCNLYNNHTTKNHIEHRIN